MVKEIKETGVRFGAVLIYLESQTGNEASKWERLKAQNCC